MELISNEEIVRERMMVADSGVVSALDSAPEHPIASNFCSIHANICFYQNVIQVAM